MQNASWEKIKPLLWQIALLSLIGLIGWFGIRPFLSVIKGRMDAIQKLSVTQEYRGKQLERLPDLEKQHGLIKERAEELEIILSKERLVDFIEQLESLALSNGVDIEIESRDNAFLESKVTLAEKKEGGKPVVGEKSENPAEPTKRGAVKETGIIAELPIKKFLKLTITLTGEYRSIVRYLHQLETIPFALDVVGLNIKEHPEEGDLVAPESGALNPFGEAALIPVVPVVASKLRLDAVFETVVYMKD